MTTETITIDSTPLTPMTELWDESPCWSEDSSINEAIDDNPIYEWSDGMGLIYLSLTDEEVHSGYHTGQCDEDVQALSQNASIGKQLGAIMPDTLCRVLREYGAWSPEELTDHDANLQRLLWLACGDCFDSPDDYCVSGSDNQA